MPSSLGYPSIAPVNTRCAGSSETPFGAKYAGSTPVGTEHTRAPGTSAVSASRSTWDTAMVSAACAQAWASHRRTLRHSSARTARRQARGSTCLRRFRIMCSTLWLNSTVGTAPPKSTLGVVARKSTTQRSTPPAARTRATRRRSAGTRHRQKCSGHGENQDRSTEAAKRAFPGSGGVWGTEITASRPGSAAASPSGSSSEAWVVATITRCRRESSEMRWRLRRRPPRSSGQSPPAFTQRIRMIKLWPAARRLLPPAEQRSLKRGYGDADILPVGSGVMVRAVRGEPVVATGIVHEAHGPQCGGKEVGGWIHRRVAAHDHIAGEHGAREIGGQREQRVPDGAVAADSVLVVQDDIVREHKTGVEFPPADDDRRDEGILGVERRVMVDLHVGRAVDELKQAPGPIRTGPGRATDVREQIVPDENLIGLRAGIEVIPPQDDDARCRVTDDIVGKRHVFHHRPRRGAVLVAWREHHGEAVLV